MDKLRDVIDKIESCICNEINKGIDCVDTEELYKVADIYKDLVEAEYHATITKAMKENADDYGDTWDENGKKYYNHNRSMRSGRYMYQEPMWSDDRMDDYKQGKMYYQEPMHKESSYDRNKRMYTESKAMNPTDKAEHLARLNKMIDSVKTDFMQMKEQMQPDEKTTMKQKLINMANEM